ncbi:MAG: DUF3592 domain-containing protein [Propionibacteriaceae bacterium]|nr:DUF3592 domain-containing protein [Propionibacteriaceae bacterium]
MTATIATRSPEFGIRGPRRTIGWALAVLAGAAFLVAIVLAVINGVLLVATAEAVGEVVAVEPVTDAAGQPRSERHRLVVEYPDRNGQFRRFDEQTRGVAPAKGDEVPVRYRMGPPVEARVANPWWIWRPATFAGATALGLGLVAEELLRNRRRFAASGAGGGSAEGTRSRP